MTGWDLTVIRNDDCVSLPLAFSLADRDLMTKKIVILGTPGFVERPERFGNADLLKAVGANSGNLVFQLATTKILSGNIYHIGFSGRPYGDWHALNKLDYFVFPAANHLRADADWTLLTKYLKQQRAPLVVLGLGAQAEHGADPARAARELRANASVVEFVDTLRSQAVLITVRGPFSEAVCHEMGLTNVLRLGCPSQFLHADPALGQTLRAQMDAIASSASPARIAITASAPNELHGWRRDAETRLVSWLPAAPGLYVQQSCDDALFDGQTGRLNPAEASDLARLFSGLGAPNGHGDIEAALKRDFRIYFDARTWIDDLAHVDLAIGTRIHGNMAAIAATKPGVLIVHDARVAELADQMHVPSLEYAEFKPCTTPQEAVARVRFDAAAFDAGRQARARLLLDAFAKIGLEGSPHLHGLADGRPHAA